MSRRPSLRLFGLLCASAAICGSAALAAEPGMLPTHHPLIERAVLDLIDEREQAPGVEKIAA